MIKPNLKPLIRLLVQPMKLVTQLARRHTLLQRLCLCRRSVLIRPADIQRRDVPRTSVSRVDVGGEGGTDDVPEVGDVVNVGEGGGDEDVALPGEGEDGAAFRGGLAHEEVRGGPDFLSGGVCHGGGGWWRLVAE